MRWIIAAVIVMLSATAWGEEVLLCTVTENTGFEWDEGAIKARWALFKKDRFIVKIISESKRTITRTTGDPKEGSRSYTCRRPHVMFKKRIVCSAGIGGQPFIFHDNTFTHAYLWGPPAGGSDLNISVAYGTCVKY